MSDWIPVQGNKLRVKLRLALALTEAFAARHPRALTGTVVSLLSGFAIAAFGIAPLAPDAEKLIPQLVQDPAQMPDLQDQLAALASNEISLSRNDQTRSSDTADTLLKRMGAFDPALAQFLRTDAIARKVLQGHAGKPVQITAKPSGEVESMVVRYAAEQADMQATHFTRLSIQRQGKAFSAKIETAPLQRQIRLGSGTIASSLFAATDLAGVPDGIASQMADIFSGDIDFRRDLQKGDRFSVVFESMTADGETVSWDSSPGQVLAADFSSKGRTYSAVWFKNDAGGKGGYYGMDGQSKHHAFLSSPMEFSRITSGFAMRFHPILQTWRKHEGIDFGAPTGTAVRAVGDGVVDFAGWQNGFGNVVILHHSNERTTLYAHLSRIDVKKGQHIEQRQKIGAVGSTGWATGPHLHFEFRTHGQLQDPATIAKASDNVTLPASAKAQFQQAVASIKPQLDNARSISEGVSGAE